MRLRHNLRANRKRLEHNLWANQKILARILRNVLNIKVNKGSSNKTYHFHNSYTVRISQRTLTHPQMLFISIYFWSHLIKGNELFKGKISIYYLYQSCQRGSRSNYFTVAFIYRSTVFWSHFDGDLCMFCRERN